MASISRSLYYMGIAGNEKAATNWAIYHNRSKWIKKQSVQGADDAPPVKHESWRGARDCQRADPGDDDCGATEGRWQEQRLTK
jgi:hypothetical protein